MLPIKNKVVYKCNRCGFQASKWAGQCTNCYEWNTFEETLVEGKKTTSSAKSGQTLRKPPQRLREVESSKSDRIVTGIGEFNRVMGGGIVRDSITIVSAKPGAGKSTLLLQVAGDVADKGLRVLYASGEESESQIKNRASRVLDKLNQEIWVMSDTSLDNVLAAIHEVDADLVIVDSIQTFTLEEQLPSRAGSPTQTMECANELLKVAKDGVKPRAVLLIGQMNKNEEIAGLRALEHLVDTVLIIESENGEELRGAWCSKNRFGSTGEMGFFAMTETGMRSIDNPSEFFMTQRSSGDRVSGCALSIIKEGTRPIVVEVESLVSRSFTPYPSRIAECLRRDQLNTLISILEQRGKIDLYDKNVVIKTTGGLQLKEQAVNLAIIMSIVSSVKDVAIPGNTAFLADVGLTGELKKVPALEMRLKELDRMGYRQVYIAKDSIKESAKFRGIKVVDCKTLSDVIAHVLQDIPKTGT